jgi:hypothetical protein
MSLYIGDVFKDCHPDSTDMILSNKDTVVVLWLIRLSKEVTIYRNSETAGQYLFRFEKKRIL